MNVAVEREDPRSILSLHRRLISLRRAEPALSVGEYSPLESAGDVLAYLRERGDRRLAILLNLGGAPQVHPLGPFEGKVLLSTHLDREGETARGTMDLRPNEGVVLELTVITASGNL